MGKRGRKPIYDAAKLERKIKKYWNSITYTETLKDSFGDPVKNLAGENIVITHYSEPPDTLALCLFLGIDRSTWNNYCNSELHPDMADITTETKMRMEAYLWRELNTRPKGVQGIKFNLENNYGYRDHKEVEIGEQTRKSVGDISALSIAERIALITSAAGQIFEEEQDDSGEDDDR